MERYKSILVISDNEPIVEFMVDYLRESPTLNKDRTFDFACNPNNDALVNKELGGYVIKSLDIKVEFQDVIDKYDMVISAHCKQIFPDELVRAKKCINIHPGYNPYNRGWYPQVFSILNGKKLGATIHEIDEELDHGRIIDRELVEVKKSDTSKIAYDKVQQAEFRLIRKNLQSILDGNYDTFLPEEEGNINYKQDFVDLQELKLDEVTTFEEAIDRLRALTHPPYRNAYFVDPKTGKRIWVKIELEEEQ